MNATKPFFCTFVLLLLVRSAAAQTGFFDPPVVPLRAPLPGGGYANVTSLRLSDLDQDGDADLVGVAASHDLLIVMKAAGGAFTQTTSQACGHSPFSIRAADLDGDGDQDVVVLCGGTAQNEIRTYLNDGTGAFPSVLVQPVPLGGLTGSLQSHEIANLDGDAIPDLLLIGGGGYTAVVVAVAPGTGTGSFGPLTYSTLLAYGSVLVADDDQDGDEDLHMLASSISTSGFFTWRNDGLGHFFGPALLRFPNSGYGMPTLTDLDLDGDLDVCIFRTQSFSLYSQSSIEVALSNGPGGSFTLAPPQIIAPSPNGASQARMADVDGDGDLDLCAWGQGIYGNLLCSLNSGGTFLPATTAAMDLSYGFIYGETGDFTGDGLDDLLLYAPWYVPYGSGYASATYASLHPSLGTAGLSRPLEVSMGAGMAAFPCLTTDLNVDGKPDTIMTMLTGGTASLSVLMDVGSAPQPQLYPVGAVLADFAITDWNRDGTPDLVMSRGTPANDVALAAGDGSGNFGPLTSYFAGSGGGAIGIVDANGDGNPDIVTGQGTGVAVLYGTGAGLGVGLALACPFAGLGPCPAVSDVEAADLDLDGFVDLLVTVGSAFSSPVDFVFMGTGSSFVLAGAAPGAVYAHKTLQDVNGDAVPDLVAWYSGLSTYASYELSVAPGLGDGTFGPIVATTITGAPNQFTVGALAFADVDANGTPDAVFAGGSVLLNDGTGAFTPGGYFMSSKCEGIDVADVDQDLRPDLITYELTRGKAAVHLNRGGCAGTGFGFGLGCAGSRGFVPRLSAFGCVAPGGVLTIQLDRALGGAPAVLFVGPTSVQMPAGFGCTAFVPASSAIAVPWPLIGPAVAGAGRASLTALLPPSVPPGTTIGLQAAIVDPASPFGIAGSNGVHLVLP
jgi:FG-GAP-like repeat